MWNISKFVIWKCVLCVSSFSLSALYLYTCTRYRTLIRGLGIIRNWFIGPSIHTHSHTKIPRNNWIVEENTFDQCELRRKSTFNPNGIMDFVNMCIPGVKVTVRNCMSILIKCLCLKWRRLYTQFNHTYTLTHTHPNYIISHAETSWLNWHGKSYGTHNQQPSNIYIYMFSTFCAAHLQVMYL